MSNEKMEWIATRTFTDEHIGRALTANELRERKVWEWEYQDEINEVSKIVKSNEYFGKLEFYQKTNVASTLIKDLKETKDINIEIKGALNGNMGFCINDLDVANKMMIMLSEAKDIYNRTLAMIVTITDKNMPQSLQQLPNECVLLEKNMLKLKKSILAILEKVKEEIQTFDFNDKKDENKQIKK